MTNSPAFHEEDSVELTREMIEGLLRSYVEAREQETAYGKTKSRIGELIRHYITTHDDEPVYDGEAKLEARLQTRSGGDAYDLQRVPEDLILLLHRLNLLTVNVAGVKAQEGREAAERLKPYRIPGNGTTALLVEQKN